MNEEKDILNRFKNKDPKSIYDIPDDYFKDLNHQVINRIDKLESNLPKIIFFRPLLKVAAVFLFLIGSYFIYNSSSNNISINYAQLNDSLEDYLISDNELYYTFIYSDKDYNYLNIDENIDDYFETEIDFY
ncbi:MAG: hypothetical protein P8L23_01660 [Flavobacteriales bacterium]|nr:hypothetical protein [Flavobacteriales bacterium]